MTYSFHPEARRELEMAAGYYEGCATGLGFDFSLEVHNAIQRIADFPSAWEELRPGIRRCLLKRFPYAVLYSSDGEHTYVLAIMHLHRRPGYWQDRLG
jgi:plasmid stabilization system protein ParE